MDLVTWIAILSGIAGIAGFIYVLLIGQKTIPEWLRDRRRRTKAAEIAEPSHPLVPALPKPSVPNNLPPRRDFVGREQEKVDVWDALTSSSCPVMIDGIGGVGKTALAVQVAYGCLEASQNNAPEGHIPRFDALVWTSARDRSLTLNELLDTIALTMDYTGIVRLPLKEKLAAITRLLQATRCLVIVDNFETIVDKGVRDFVLDVREPSRTLLTSREQILPEAQLISLHGLTRDESLELIRAEGKKLGLPKVEEADETSLGQVHELTGGAPQAIKWTIGRIKHGQSLGAVIENLSRAEGDLFRYMFAHSWELLPDTAQRVLMIMPIFASSSSKAAIQAASDIRQPELDEGMEQLIETWLVEEVTGELEEEKRRFGVHPLTRAFAREHLKAQQDFEKLSRLRAAKYFLEFAQHLVGSGYHHQASKKAYDVLELERENILSAMEWCHETGERQLFIDLTVAMVHFLGRRGFWHERMVSVTRAVEAAHEAKSQHNDEAEMWLCIDALGWIYLEQGNPDAAEESITQGQIIAERYAHRCGMALAHYYLARVARARKQKDVALQHAIDGLSVECDDLNIVAHLHTEQGELANQSGDYDESIRQFQQALLTTDRLEAGQRIGHWGSMMGLADALYKLGRYDEAREYYEEVARTAGEVKAFVARAKLGLAYIEESACHFAKALSLAQEAARQFEQLGIEDRMIQSRQLAVDGRVE